jgi:hypothetical protein
MPGFAFRTSYGKRDFNAEFPYQVAFREVSAEATRLMEKYCSARFIPFRKRKDMRGYLRYCFAKPEPANRFSREFGGERIDVAVPKSPAGSSARDPKRLR